MKILLSTICISLLGLFAYQVMSFPLDLEESRDRQKMNKDGDIPQDLKFDLPQLAVLYDIDEYSEIIQRPLFVKNRTSAHNAQSLSEAVTVNELEHLVLVGTASSTDVQIGIVADTKEKKIERIKVGQLYKDWKVVTIANDHIVFQNDDLDYKLFVTPFDQNNNKKRANLTAKAVSKIKTTYKGWKSKAKPASNKTETDSDAPERSTNKPREKVAGSLWNYKKKSDQESGDVVDEQPAVKEKPVRKSPIKIPGDEDEKDSSYYEALDDGGAENATESSAQEIDADDFYGENEEITEDELKALEAMGAKIFDD